ncbi:hypothetical protein DLD77_01415 [Chitinophaga alhagiae]|uniref:DUF4595 domain-containing protein n=1 Tax=Chitinophaga alhagiae TaxID=2203219 RepID=A0ABN5LQM0_9BACT|nr:hypothetical protein [Chitinophaga alhagiae]AWO00458.1 hypothetical protein DLD77_01415 [Chitinophaga alhagiae]
MKNIIPCLPLALCLLAACSKKKDATPDEQQQEKIAVSRLMHETDTIAFTYRADGTLQQFKQYGQLPPFSPDSTQVVYTGGQISAFKIWVMGDEQPRNDRGFQYNAAQQLSRISYYNMISETELVITDYDSLVYGQGKLSALHVINGSQRNEVYRLTWDKDNVSKVELYQLIGGEEVLYKTTTLTYTDKDALGRSFPGQFLFLHTSGRDFTTLSANAPLKAETVEEPGAVNTELVTYEYAYNNDGLPEKIMTRTGAGGTPVTTGIAYVSLP